MNVATTVKRITLPGGFHCYYEHWFPANPRGLILIVPGMAQYTTKFRNIINELVNRGYGVAVYDQRGFGRSLGRRGDVSSNRVWINDLHEFIQFTVAKLNSTLPVIFLGEGIGAPLVINYLVERRTRALAFVGLFSFMKDKIKLSWWKKKFPRALSFLLPFIRVTLSRERDPLSIGYLSLRAWKDFSLLLNNIDALAYRLGLPVLMFTKKTRQSQSRLDDDKDFFSRLQQVEKKLIECDENPVLSEELSKIAASEIDNWLRKGLKLV